MSESNSADSELPINPLLVNPAIAPTPKAADPAPVVVPPKAADPAPAADAWKEYVDDPAKSAEENATARAANEAAKPAPAVAAPVVAPLDFAKDIKLADGFKVDETVAKEFTEIINDAALTPQARAQKLIDLQTKVATEGAKSATEAWDKFQEDNKAKVMADPDVGGTKNAKVMADIGALIDNTGRLFGPNAATELRQVMDLTGAGNFPIVVKYLNYFASKLNEGVPVKGDPLPASEQSAAAILFPSMKKA